MTDDDLESIIVTAGSAYSQGRFLEALQLYEKAIAARPTNAILFANKAAILLRLDRVEAALQSANRAIELDPTWAKAYYRRGEALRRQNSLLPALVSLCEGAALDPHNHVIVKMLTDVAAQFFENFPIKRLESLGLERDRFTVLTVVGQELASAGHLREATVALTRAVSLKSPSLRLREPAFSALASVHFSLGEHQEAVHYYDKQLEIRAQLGACPSDIHDNIATCAEMAGNYSIALAHREKRLNTLEFMDAMEERLKIARLHCSLSQPEAALKQCDVVQKLMESITDDEKTRITAGIQIARGIAYASMGETVKCLEQLTGLSPPNEDDAIRIADAVVTCHIKDGSIQNAIEYLNALLKTSSENRQQKVFGHTCFLLAREHIRNGRPSSAIRLAKRILRLARTTTDRGLEKAGLQLLATIYEEQEDMQSANVLLQKYMEVPGVTVVEAVNTLLRLSTLSKRIGVDPLEHLNEALRRANASGNHDIIASAQSAMLRHLMSLEQASYKEKVSQVLLLQKELLKSDINTASRSLIFEDLAMCEEGETSGVNELQALEQSLTEAQEGNNVRRELFLLEKLGDCLLSMQRFKDAEGFYQQLLTLAQHLRAAAQIKRAYMKLAILAAGSEQWDRCAEMSKRALTLSRFLNDHPAKAHMMLLTGKAELFRQNHDVAHSIFNKTFEFCKEHALDLTMTLASRYMVDAAIRADNKDALVIELLRRHLSLIEYENDQKAILKSVIRLARHRADQEHLYSLRIVGNAKKMIHSLAKSEQPEMFLECFDVYRTLGMLDEAWRLLMEILNLSSLSDTALGMIAEKLAVLPLRRRVLPIFKLIENGYMSSVILAQFAFFAPKLALQLLDDKQGSSAHLVSYLQLEDWVNVLSHAEAASSHLPDNMSLDGLFCPGLTEGALSLIARWRNDRSVAWSLLSKQSDATFCRFFDDAHSRILEGGFTPTLRTRAHLHTLMLRQEFDLTHEAAGPIEKIICAANTGCKEMISMWYHELVEQYLSDNTNPIDLFPYSSTEFELKMATVFLAFQHKAFDEQLQILEMGKWLMDKRLSTSHGRPFPPFPTIDPPTDNTFTYIYKLGRVELSWTTLDEGSVAISFELLSTDISFLEECLVNYLRGRGLPEGTVNGAFVEEAFTNDHSNNVRNPKFYRLQDSCSLHYYRYELEATPNGHQPLIQDMKAEVQGPLTKMLRQFSNCPIAVVSTEDRILHPDTCISVGATPFIVITKGTLPFDIIRALFLCGTAVVVEFAQDVAEEDIDELLHKICGGSDLMHVLSTYKSYVRSRTVCLSWSASVEYLTNARVDISAKSISMDRVDVRKDGEPTLVKAVSDSIRETLHIENLWLRQPLPRVGNVQQEMPHLPNLAKTLLSTLEKDLNENDDSTLTNLPSEDMTKRNANRLKRRKKKLRNRSLRGYMSDEPEGIRSDSIHTRSGSEELFGSVSLAHWSAAE